MNECDNVLTSTFDNTNLWKKRVWSTSFLWICKKMLPKYGE